MSFIILQVPPFKMGWRDKILSNASETSCGVPGPRDRHPMILSGRTRIAPPSPKPFTCDHWASGSRYSPFSTPWYGSVICATLSPTPLALAARFAASTQPVPCRSVMRRKSPSGPTRSWVEQSWHSRSNQEWGKRWPGLVVGVYFWRVGSP